MVWNDEGFLVANQKGTCDCDGSCIDVCPFNPFPKDEVKTEDEIGELFLKDSTKINKNIGKYIGIYAGFSNEYRLSSSSGGLGTYISNKLLEKGIVDHVFSVKESAKPGTYYEYEVSSNKSDLQRASKTRYFPVTMSNVFSEINNLQGKVAVVGVGCFIKAIRLAQYTDTHLKEKIPFLIGIICGGVKSRFFTEYLASKLDVMSNEINSPQFRQKDLKSSANDYSFACTNDHGERKSIKMRTVGDMWGTGLFKANACDFCDDVTTELADISLGDAWLPPYYLDGKGTNVVVTRSLLAENLIIEGLKSNELFLEKLSLETFVASQQGSFNHRHLGMPARIKNAKKIGRLVPPKRYEKEKITVDFKWVQKQRMKVRSKSLQIWQQDKDAKVFDKKMKKSLKKLKFLTQIYHRRRRFDYLRGRIMDIIKLKLTHK